MVCSPTTPNPDAAQLTALVGTPPQHGELALADNGSFTYTPAEGYLGPDEFTYRVDDGHGISPPAVVRLAIESEQLLINEWMASNGLTLTDSDGDTSDWLEIHNRSTVTATLGGWYLTDQADDLTNWQFPDGVQIPADSYLIVFASGKDRPDVAAPHTSFRLAAAGDYLALVAPDGHSVVSEFGSAEVPFPPQSSDVSFGWSADQTGYLLAATPGGPNSAISLGTVEPLTVDMDHGFYQSPFEVTLTTPSNFAEIRYTLDGSAPTATHGMMYTGPIPITGTSVLRAAAFAPQWFSARLETRSYLFLSDIVQQSLDGTAPPGWPTRLSGSTTNYGLDPEIVDDPIWGPQLEAALQQIPSLSLVIDLEHLFDTETGIYTNSTSQGREWERPASLELLPTDGSPGFQVEMGVRIRGGFSRAPNNPKHSLRFFFREAYGDGPLQFPLFGEEGASSFDGVDLRTAQNYSWSLVSGQQNTFLRDEFARLSQGELGQPYTRGDYHHLYMNGQYWGLFQTEERPEASYSATYFGGSAEDYDTIKLVRSPLREIGASDGNTDAYNRLRLAALAGFSENADYYRVQGYEADGSTRNPDYERLLDVDNLIDFMILAYYTGDSDSPAARPTPNNLFATFNRQNPDGFKWFEHDSEHSLDTGANDLVNPFVIEHDEFESGIADCPTDACTHPAGRFSQHWLHELLMENADYRQRFADRVQRHFAAGGQLSEPMVLDRIDRLTSQIDLAVIAESARWGDTDSFIPYTKDDWIAAVEAVKDWVPGRADIVLEQFRTVNQEEGRAPWNWFPSFDAPQLSHQSGHLPVGTNIQIFSGAASADAQLFYTLDGSDPRLPGGELNPQTMMIAAGEALVLERDVQLFVRGRLQGEWSAATEAAFLIGSSADVPLLRISELHYHPAPPTPAEIVAGHDNSNDFEFVELVNVGPTPIDLSQLQLVQVPIDDEPQGVAFRFSEGSIGQLEPGEYLLVVEDIAAFNFRYGSGLPVAGQWTGGLSNNREQLTLQRDELILQQFAYDDEWHPTTDGAGASLEVMDPGHPNLERWALPTGWQPSPHPNGTPGRSRVAMPAPGDFDDNGQVDTSDIDQLTAELAAGHRAARFDLTGDGRLTADDRETLLFGVLGTTLGDADLDGQVTTNVDGARLLDHLGRPGPWGWADGDFDGDGLVSASGDGALLLAALAADRAGPGDPWHPAVETYFAELPLSTPRSTWQLESSDR